MVLTALLIALPSLDYYSQIGSFLDTLSGFLECLGVDLLRVEDLEAVDAGPVPHGDGLPLGGDVAVLPGDLSGAVVVLLAAVRVVAGRGVGEG